MNMSLSKPVQELLINGDELPEKYIQKGRKGDGAVSFPHLEVPVIDLSLLTSSSQPTREDELEKLRSALVSCGCIQLINHGIANSFLDKLDEVSKEFFALPAAEKQKYSRTLDDLEGYGNDTVLSDQQILDWTDRLYLTLSPLEQRKLKFWPQKPENFREALDEYTKKLKVTSELILKAMAKSLNIGEHSFLEQYGEGLTMMARFNFYPPCPRPDLTLGVKPHADASAITFLLPDKEVEGLQLLKDDQWHTVPIVPHAMLINVGDYTEIMSNGTFKSPMHRVITNSERPRNTLAVFCIPDPDKEIKPIDELIDDARPRLYKNVVNYVGIYFENYQLGKRPIDAVKI